MKALLHIALLTALMTVGRMPRSAVGGLQLPLDAPAPLVTV
jgi:hypothetical protein